MIETEEFMLLFLIFQIFSGLLCSFVNLPVWGLDCNQQKYDT